MTSRADTAIIGVTGPLSGDRVAHSPLVYHADSTLGRLGIRRLLSDDRAEPARAMEVARDFAEKKVTAVIGHFNSACASAAAPIYAAAGIPLLLPASTQTDLTSGNGVNPFRLCSTDLEQAKLMLSFNNQSLSRPAYPYDVAVDGTPYSRRLQQALEEACGREIDVVGIKELPEEGIKLRFVFATCTNSIVANHYLKSAGWQGIAVYADDAHIEEFTEQLQDSEHMKSVVIGSAEDYEELITKGCQLLRQGLQSGTANMHEWLSRSGLFLPNGDFKDASWQLYVAQDRKFIPAQWDAILSND